MKIDVLKGFFAKYKKPLYIIGFSLLFFFLFSEVGFASDNPSSSSTGTGNGTDLGKIVIDVINGGIKIAAALLGLLTAFVSLFLYPGWVNGSIFGLQEYLKEMWILVSNVVYFVFAFILIAIAFMNIIGKGDKWELKNALPRFVVGVLIVPFSWFFVQFVLSISAILTVGVLTLPYDTFQEKDIFKELDEGPKICTHMKVHLGSTSGDGNSTSASSSSGGSRSLGEFMECDTSSEKTIGEILSGKNSDGDKPYQSSIFGIVSIYTYGILKVDKLDTITKGDLTSIKAIFDLGLKGIFDIIFIFMYLILMAALFLALFVRGIWLWMYAMFSPAFGLLYFFEKGKDGVGSEHKFSITEFISLALVPVYVSAALSFGLVFLYVASEGIDKKATGESSGQEPKPLELGGFKLTITGAQGASGQGGDEDATEQSVLARLVIQIFGLAMLWIAVMAALKQSAVTEKITKPIADFGGSVGSLVASAPMYAPIIPAGGGKMMSATSLGTAGASIKTAVEGDQTSKGTKFGQETAARLGFGDSDIGVLQQQMATFGNSLQGASTDKGIQASATKKLFDSIDNEKLSKNKRLKEDFIKYLKEIFGNDAIKDTVERDILKASKGDLPQAIKKLTDSLSAAGHGLALEQTFGTSTPTSKDIQNKLEGVFSQENDNSGIRFAELGGEGFKLVNSHSEIKVKREDTGKIEIATKTLTGESEIEKFVLNTTKLDAKDISGTDLDQGKEMRKALGSDAKLKDVLDALGYKNSDELAKKINQ